MSFPPPLAGMVIRYAYLWRDEQHRGLEDGRKDRPCAVLLAVANQASGKREYVLPITHSPPHDRAEAIELPQSTKRRLGLDGERSWVVLTEANRFDWPGPDLRQVRPEDASGAIYGELPGNLFRQIKAGWLALAAERKSIVTRTE